MLKQFGKTKLSRRSAGFIKAFRDPPLAPATVLCFSFIGFGVLCRGAHIGLAPSLYTTMFIFALPAQVVLVDQIARDIPLWTTAVSVAFTGVRLLPMTVSLIPYLRAGRGPRFFDYFVAHFVAVTMWIESMRRIPFLPSGMPYYFGLAIILVGVSVAGTVAGYLIADQLPLAVAASHIFLTPAYFLLGMLGNCRQGSDYAPVLLGVCLEPVAAKIAPSFDLVLTGLVAGTASFFIFRRTREAPKPQSVATIPGYRDAG
jgi:predicted branched-subunit amino acid permease